MLRASAIPSVLSVLALGALMAAAVPGSATAQTAAEPAPKAAKAKPAKKDKAAAADAGKQDPAEAQKHLVAGQAALAGGKADVAVTNLNAALAGRGLNEQDLAKALYLRGAAYRLLQKPALAIADLNGALYIRKGLGEADRRDADEQRAAAYREAGLPDQRVTPAAQKPAVAATAAAPTTTASAAATPAAAAAAPAAASGSGGIGKFFGSLFGGSSSATPVETAAAPAPAAQPAQPAVTSWSTKTQTPSSTTPPGPPPSKAGAALPVVMQLANVRTRVEAERISARVAEQNGGDLTDRSLDVVENIAGSFGTLYAVRLGPFASADDSRALCTKLRSQGLDCLAIPAR